MALVNRTTPLGLVVVGAAQRGLVDRGLRVPRELDGRIEFRGQLNTSTELAQLYRAATLLVFPSFYESFGLPALEAMAHGCPVVASDIPALREVCGDAAVYCNPHDPSDIAEKILMVASDSQLRERLRRLGLARAREFSWEKSARQTLAILRSVTAHEIPASAHEAHAPQSTRSEPASEDTAV